MLKEIGSEFHYTELKKGNGIKLPKVKDYSFTFSGRTAIETFLKNEPHIKKVLLPSYCCDSMIDPFRKRGIKVIFYSVNYKDGLNIDIVSNMEDIDAILWCNYFGFDIDMPDFSKFVNEGGIIIEDITQSFYSDKQYHEQSHYIVASLRKWEPIVCGGYVGCTYKRLKDTVFKLPPIDYVSNKLETMKLKKDYLIGLDIDKELFLTQFNKSNNWLSENYSGLYIDNFSLDYLKNIDMDQERNIRRNNAKILYEGLKDNKNIKFLFKEEDMDCPLFIPIIIEKGKRDIIRNILINHQIYCPIHWPNPSECESNLYDLELSLICDQRYSQEDMNKIVLVINSLSEGLL